MIKYVARFINFHHTADFAVITCLFLNSKNSQFWVVTLTVRNQLEDIQQNL